MEDWLDLCLGGLQWYRRKRGGTWHLITIKSMPGFGECWIRGTVHYPTETILKTEVYG